MTVLVSWIFPECLFCQEGSPRPMVTLSSSDSLTNLAHVFVKIEASEPIQSFNLSSIKNTSGTIGGLRTMPKVTSEPTQYYDLVTAQNGDTYFVRHNRIGIKKPGEDIVEIDVTNSRNQLLRLERIVLNSDGNLVIANVHTVKKVEIYNIEGELLQTLGHHGNSEEKFPALYTVALDQSGNIYVGGYGEIEIFDPAGQYIRSVGNTGTNQGEFYQVSDLFIDASNNIYLLDNGNYRVQVIDQEGNFQFFFEERTRDNYKYPFFPLSVDVDKEGNVLIADQVNRVISVYDLHGKYSHDIPYRFKHGVNRVHVDQNNRIHIIDYGFHSILEPGNNYAFDLISNIPQETIELQIPENAITDMDGNGNVSSNILKVQFDRVNPTVSLTSTNGDVTAINPVPIDIQFSEVIQNFEVNDLKISNGTVLSLLEIKESKDYSKFLAEIEPIGNEVTMALEIREYSFNDIARNSNVEGAELTIRFKNDIVLATIEYRGPSIINSGPIDIDINFSEGVLNFTSEDIDIENGSVVSFNGSGKSYSAVVQPVSEGEIRIVIPPDIAVDQDGNGNLASNQISVQYDATPPVVTLIPQKHKTNQGIISVKVLLSEEIRSIVKTDVLLDFGYASNWRGSGLEYQFEANFNLDREERVIMTVLPNTLQDLAGNWNDTKVQLVLFYDDQPPVPTVTSQEYNIINYKAYPLNVEFSEPVAGLQLQDIVYTGGEVKNLEGSDSNYTFEVQPTTEGIFEIYILAGAVMDEAGNSNTISNSFPLWYDLTQPKPIITSSESNSTSKEVIPINIEFNEPIFDFVANPTACLVFAKDCFTAEDLNISGGVIEDFSGSNGTYSANIVSGVYTQIEVYIPASVTSDRASNLNLASDTWTIQNINGIITDVSKDLPIEEKINIWFVEQKKLQIELDHNSRKLEVSILDITGRLQFLSNQSNLESWIIDMSMLKPGPYLVSVSTDNYKTTKRIILE